MSRNVSIRIRSIIPAGLALAALVLVPFAASAASHEGGGTAEEIKALIMEGNTYARENLKDQEGTVSKDGALEFWSSGGLMQWVPADAPASEYDYFSMTPKHIKVVTLVEGQAAVAMYYSEGSFKPKGGAAIDHYMTRVTVVYVKEDGAWKVRAAHWSPIAAGSGTTQTAID